MFLPVQGRVLAFVIAILLLCTTPTSAQVSRFTPEVLAVQKTKDAIVTIKVMFRGNYGNSKPVYGSGVIIDDRGYAVTNAHVVGSYSAATVILWDGTELAGTVHAVDTTNDIAIIKLPSGRTYKELRLAPSSDLMHAERIVAVGNPFGYQKTTSTGSISGLDREVNMDGVKLKGLIQIDAPINPGNSGGPVLNINGELIGIVCAVRDGANGIAFAIPSDNVAKVLAKHLSARQVASVEHGLNVKSQVVKPEGDDRAQVIVQQVEGAAAKAGLKNNDVILKVDGRPVANSFDLERALWSASNGHSVEASVLRDGKVKQVSLTPVRLASAN
jgi:serine protease Do